VPPGPSGDRWQRRDGSGGRSPNGGQGRGGSGGRWDGQRDGQRQGRPGGDRFGRGGGGGQGRDDGRWNDHPPEPYDREPSRDGSGDGSRDAIALPAPRMALPDPRDPVAATERRALEAVLQLPDLIPPEFDDLDPDAFTAPAYRAVHAAVRAAGGGAAARRLVAGGGPTATVAWVEAVREEAAGPVEGLITQLAVAPLPEDRPDRLPSYARGLVMALVEMEITRRIADLRGKLQRMDARVDPEGYRTLAAQLFDEENRRRALRESA
jgi:DNA primase